MGAAREEQHNFLLYDYLQVAGGAERVTLAMAAAWPHFRTIVSRVYKEAAPLLPGKVSPVSAYGTAATRCLGRIPEAVFNFKYRGHFLAGADTVVYSGYYAPLAVHHQRAGRRIYYCHALPRFAYDLTDFYRARFPVGSRWAFDLAMAWIRREYGEAIARMDMVVANSENVRRRLKKFLNVEAQVIHPPVATDRFRWLGDRGYYLSTARLTGSKRVDVVVEAFRRMPDRQLVVVSGGPDLVRVRRLAGEATNIRILDWQSEEAMRDWVGHARAVVYVPIDEDFGMSPVEAMAAGKPVVGVAAGGLLETVVDGETGVLVEEPLDPIRLVAAVARLDALEPGTMRTTCERRAALFSELVFLGQMGALLDTQRPGVGGGPSPHRLGAPDRQSA